MLKSLLHNCEIWIEHIKNDIRSEKTKWTSFIAMVNNHNGNNNKKFLKRNPGNEEYNVTLVDTIVKDI